MREFEHPRGLKPLHFYVPVGLLWALGAVLGLMVAYSAIQWYIDTHMVDRTYGHDSTNAPLILNYETCSNLSFWQSGVCDRIGQ